MNLGCTARLTLLVVATALVVGCGGGSSSTTPVPTGSDDPYGGQGAPLQFNQKVNFTVIVPPPAALLTARTRHKTTSSSRRRSNASTTATTNTYVSPNVASVTIALGSVDGSALRNAPVTTVTDVTCSGNSGCSVPIQGVPAANGTDLFTIETFSGPKASGNLISTSSIPVNVPSAQATSFGGTALTIGGFVESVSLSADIPGETFFYNTAGKGSLNVNAIDPAGAVIIGDTILQNSIAIDFPSQDVNGFSFPSGTSTTLSGPAQLAFTYNGAAVIGPFVTANTLDYNGNPISASLTLPVAPAPTMKPTAPPMSAAQSLYVFDGQGDRILEYSGINDLEGGGNVTVRRVFDIAPPPGASFTCNYGQNVPIAAGFAVGADGTIYVQTDCVDSTSAIGYVFAYSPTAADTISGSGAATPPIPTVIPINTGAAAYTPTGIKIDPISNQLLVSYFASNPLGPSQSTPQIIGLSLANLNAPDINFGLDCIGLIGTAAPCNASALVQSTFSPAPIPINFALDGLGSVLVVTTEPPNAPEPSSEQYSNQMAVVALPENEVNAEPVATAALSGYDTELAGSGGIAIAADGGTLYALIDADDQAITQPGTTNMVYPGFSACPPPSANAMPNIPNILCASSFTDFYLAVYHNLLPTFAGSGSVGHDLSTPPDLMIGGDGYGMFGTSNPAGPGDLLAVHRGYVYVINDTPISGVVNLPPAVQVYNTNGLEGFRTDKGPFQTVSFPQQLPNNAGYAVLPASIVIAPTGSSTSGTSLLLRKPRVMHNLRAAARAFEARGRKLRSQVATARRR